MVLLHRLLNAGADDRMWASQFGFRPGRNTEQALHCSRRAIDLAVALRGGSAHLLALDWAKAFDSISPESLVTALRRFGVPQQFLDVVRSIYTDRTFFVVECGVRSGNASQHAGVCQGCPLSPFLFGIVMTVLMTDAYEMLGPGAKRACEQNNLFDVLYADDTLIIGNSTAYVEELAHAVECAGSNYGLKLHWGKTQALSIGTSKRIRRPDGTTIEETGSLLYLGGLLTENGRLDSELSRRLGLASGDFQRLQRFWSHGSISRPDKLVCFQSFVVSTLTYGLSTMSLAKAQRRRVDGFFARCLRRIIGIPHSFYSRVSNQTVYRRAGTLPLTEQLAKQQLNLLGIVARSPADSPLRRNTFIGDTLQPTISHYIRKVGRPRTNWTESVLKDGAARFQSSQALADNVGSRSREEWKAHLNRIFVKPVASQS